MLHRGEEITYITFNYDTLIEDAFEAVYSVLFDRTDLRSYTERPRRLSKLHGSIGWILRTPEYDGDEALLYQGKDIIGLGERMPEHLVIAPDTTAGMSRTCTGFYYIPAIAVPLGRKSDFVCPDDQRHAAAEALSTATRLLVVGWAGNDRHLYEQLWLPAGGLRSDARVTVVSKGRGHMTVDKMRENGITTDDVVVHDLGFTDFLDTPGNLDEALG